MPPKSWCPATEWDIPGPAVVDIWRLPLDASTVDWDLLSPAERASAERIRLEGKKVQKASARSLLRRILALYLTVSPQALEFAYGAHGKPRLTRHPLEFNLSHSKDLGLLAVAAGPSRDTLGIDLEYARDGRAFVGIAKRFFSTAERDVLLALEPALQCEAFYRAWVRKEAYLKAHGTGLSFSSRRFSIDYGTEHSGRVVSTEMPGDKPERWRFADIDVASQFVGALCFTGESRTVRCWDAPRHKTRG